MCFKGKSISIKTRLHPQPNHHEADVIHLTHQLTRDVTRDGLPTVDEPAIQVRDAMQLLIEIER